MSILQPAGRAWVDRFPTERTTAGLVQPFRGAVERFITALEKGGAKVHISATRRPKERAWLMHYAWEIAREGIDPKTVPAHEGIDILWTREGAVEMVAAYGLAFKPSLNSRHIDGKAIDMDVSWSQPIAVDMPGVGIITIAVGDVEDLYRVGEAYGVKKLRSDRPHWSTDGR